MFLEVAKAPVIVILPRAWRPVVNLFTSQLLLVLTFACPLDDGAGLTAEQLYQQAAKAIESGNPQDAAEPLRDLVEQHGNSPLALPSAVRLAELELISGRIAESVRLLVEWIPKNSSQASSDSERIDQTDDRLQRLLVTALAQLPKDQTDWLSQLVLQGADSGSGSSDPGDLSSSNSKVDLLLVRELAKRAVQSGKLELAIDWIERLGTDANERERRLRDFHLPLAILRLNPSPENIRRVQRVLAIEHDSATERPISGESVVGETNSLDLSQLVSLRLAIAEAFRLIDDPTSAIRELDFLAEQLAKHSNDMKARASIPGSRAIPPASPTDPHPDSGGLAQREPAEEASPESSVHCIQAENWRATVDLRRAELLLLVNDFRSAFTLLSTAIDMYPRFPNRDEFCFLLARCWIADIEFDKAADELRMVISRNEASSESTARGLWMLGEIEFLKREYDQAILHYIQVGQIDSQPTWQVRGLLQLGKCYELSTRFPEAAAVYETIDERFADSEVADVARDRLAVLRERVPQASAQQLPQKPDMKKIR